MPFPLILSRPSLQRGEGRDACFIKNNSDTGICEELHVKNCTRQVTKMLP